MLNRINNKILKITIAGVIITLAFVLSACNLFQSVDDAEKDLGTPPPIENVKPEYDDYDWDNSYVNVTIKCDKLLDDMAYKHVPNNLKQYIPENGVILDTINTKISKGDTAFTILLRVCKENEIEIRYRNTDQFGYYIESINNLPEKMLDIALSTYSGWMYKVNGSSPPIGVGGYRPVNEDNIVIYYTC